MAINNQPTIKPRTVTGMFTKYIAKVIPLAFDESMSYYECLCALLDYINKNVIPALDNNAEGLLELQEFYVELQSYVNNYFDNLDVQEEINNKLDEMVISGELQSLLLEQYNKFTDNFKINLENVMTYYTNETDHIQGCCIDDNDTLYIYQTSDNITGNLLKFSILNKTYIGVIENVKLYHGNDLAYLDNKIYAASVYDSSGQHSKVLCIYDILNNTVTEINPFNNASQTTLFAITNYDSSHLLCILNSDESFQTLNSYIIDVTDYSIVNIPITNTKDYQTNRWTNFQACDYDPETQKLILNVVFPNQILVLKLKNNTFNLEETHPIANYDYFGVPIGEMQGLTHFPTNLYGKHTIFVNSIMQDNVSNMIIRGYFFNLQCNVPETNRSFVNANAYKLNNRAYIYVNNTNTSIYQDGTTNYPYTDLNMAIEAAKRIQNNFPTVQIIINGGNNYNLYEIYNLNNVTFSSQNVNNLVINCPRRLTIQNSNILFYLAGATFNLADNMVLDNAIVNTNNINLVYTGNSSHESMITVTNWSKLNILNATIDGNDLTTYGVINRGTGTLIARTTISKCTTTYRCIDQSFSIIYQPSQNNVSKTVDATVINMGYKSYE